MSGLPANELERIRGLVADKVRERADSPGGLREATILDQQQRARQGNPEVVMWCPTCQERALPMRGGTCGFCDTKLRKIPRARTVAGNAK